MATSITGFFGKVGGHESAMSDLSVQFYIDCGRSVKNWDLSFMRASAQDVQPQQNKDYCLIHYDGYDNGVLRIIILYVCLCLYCLISQENG